MTTAAIAIQAAPTGSEAPPPEVDPDRPEWLPENIADGPALANSYKELQAELTRLKQGTTKEPTAEEKAAADKATADQAALDKATADKAALDKLAAGGIDYPALQAKFMEAGKLDDADYESLAKLGFPKDVVDGHIAAQQSEAGRLRTETLALVGGEEAFETIAGWVRTNYTPEQLAAYNDAVESGNVSRMQLAVKAVKADYDKAKGVSPKLLKSTNAGPQAGGEYESMAQLLRDQATPLYRSDPAERARVKAKLERSKI